MVRQKSALSSPCKALEQDLVLFYYGELSDAERSNIETHIQSCQPCALYVRELKSLLPLTVETEAPLPDFWDNYRREMRRKLDQLDERKPWWRSLPVLFQSWTLPALATAAVIALALTLTFGRTIWHGREEPVDEAFIEALPMAENLEFFSTMEVLDALDLLEYLDNNPSGAA
jgi:anti-sigma factor RsiW